MEEWHETERLHDVAAMALSTTLASGADLADVSIGTGISRQVEVRDNRIAVVTAHQAREATIRAIVQQRVGIYRLHSLSEKDVRAGAQRAVEIARSSEPDPDFHDLPHPDKQPAPPGLFDPAVEKLELATLRQWALDNISGALNAAPDVRVSGVTAAFAGRGVIMNSNGVDVSEEGSTVTLDFFAVLRKGDEAGSYFGFSEARDLASVVPAGIGARAAAQAQVFLNSRDIPAGQYSLVLAPLAAYDLLRNLAHAASAEEHQRKRSFFSGRAGEAVAPEFFSLTDDPLIPKGIYSGAYDGEGAARKKVDIISGGRLSHLLHSSYTANKAGVLNTGHGGRAGGVFPTNLVPALGEHTHDELLSSVDNGILILAGSLDPDPVTGEMSTLLDFALKIEKGKIAYPIRSATIADKIQRVLHCMTAVSADYEELPGNPMPYVVFEGVNLVGAG